MENLILTMLEALDDYSESDLNFTKKEVDKLAEEHINFDNLQCNELGLIILEENGYITMEKLGDILDFDYKDKNFILTFNDFNEILSDKYSFEIKVLDQDNDFDRYTDYYEADVKYNWSNYDNDTLTEIIKYCIDNGLEFDEELMTEENTKIIDGKAYFKDEELCDIIDDDGLDDLYNILNNSICDAQSDADNNEVVKQIINNFENDIGVYERKYNKDTKKEYIELKVDIDLSEIKSTLKEWYGEYEFETENYGSLESILSEKDYFEFNTPDYSYTYGTIDYSYLNEITRDRLSWG